jgi:hypothetical protein
MMMAGLEHVNVARRRIIERKLGTKKAGLQKKAGLRKSPA